MHLAAVRVCVAAADLKAEPTECHIAAAAPHRNAPVWIRVANLLARWAGEVQCLVELWLDRLGSEYLSIR
jgi:hypothetical protein